MGNELLGDSPEAVLLLLKKGHSVNCPDNDGNTPLLTACSSVAIKSIPILLEYGANIKHKNNYGETCIHLVARYCHSSILSILVDEYNADW